WTLPGFPDVVLLVAVASGPGVHGLYWPIAKPYQPTSPHVNRRVIGSTGAVWLDGDRDGKGTSAYGYAQRLIKTMDGDTARVVHALADYDEAVAVQIAGLLQARGVVIQDERMMLLARKAGKHVERGFEAFAQAWRECQVARTK